MTQIKKITDKQGNDIYLRTHTKAVVDDNGYTAESRLQAMQDEINQSQLELGAVPSDLTPTENSTNWVTSGGIYAALSQGIRVHKVLDTAPDYKLLPDGYELLNYIEETGQGDQIQLPFLANNINSIYLEYERSANISANYEAIFSNTYVSEDDNIVRLIANNNRNDQVLCTFNVKTSSSKALTLNQPYNGKHVVYMDASAYTVDGNSVTPSTTKGGDNNTAITLFPTNSNRTSAYKIYRMEIVYSQAKHILLPCKNENNEYGLFDLYDELFYGSNNNLIIGG